MCASKNTTLRFIFLVVLIICSSCKEKIKGNTALKESKKLYAVKKCDVEKVKDIYKNINSVSSHQIEIFLLTFNKECRTNIEYSEFSNEVLFKLLDTRTKEVVDVLMSNKNIDLETILIQLKNPIDDSIDIYSLKNKLESLSSEVNQSLVEKMILSL